jgi:hypothetical protein
VSKRVADDQSSGTPRCSHTNRFKERGTDGVPIRPASAKEAATTGEK